MMYYDVTLNRSDAAWSGKCEQHAHHQHTKVIIMSKYDQKVYAADINLSIATCGHAVESIDDVSW